MGWNKATLLRRVVADGHNFRLTDPAGNVVNTSLVLELSSIEGSQASGKCSYSGKRMRWAEAILIETA